MKPESAGAVPGPACYGNGGTAATVTDANVVLGYLDASAFMGGARPLEAPGRLHVVVARDVVGRIDRQQLVERRAGCRLRGVQLVGEHLRLGQIREQVGALGRELRNQLFALLFAIDQ